MVLVAKATTQRGGREMKCKRCNGKGRRMEESDNGIGWIPVKCEYCNGTGILEQTNEEWFCKTASTEERAMELESVIRRILVQRAPMCHMVSSHEFWENWLKQPHREETCDET